MISEKEQIYNLKI